MEGDDPAHAPGRHAPTEDALTIGAKEAAIGFLENEENRSASALELANNDDLLRRFRDEDFFPEASGSVISG